MKQCEICKKEEIKDSKYQLLMITELLFVIFGVLTAMSGLIVVSFVFCIFNFIIVGLIFLVLFDVI